MWQFTCPIHICRSQHKASEQILQRWDFSLWWNVCVSEPIQIQYCFPSPSLLSIWKLKGCGNVETREEYTEHSGIWFLVLLSQLISRENWMGHLDSLTPASDMTISGDKKTIMKMHGSIKYFYKTGINCIALLGLRSSSAPWQKQKTSLSLNLFLKWGS